MTGDCLKLSIKTLKLNTLTNVILELPEDDPQFMARRLNRTYPVSASALVRDVESPSLRSPFPVPTSRANAV
jgi:hypothetical protein